MAGLGMYLPQIWTSAAAGMVGTGVAVAVAESVAVLVGSALAGCVDVPHAEASRPAMRMRGSSSGPPPEEVRGRMCEPFLTGTGNGGCSTLATSCARRGYPRVSLPVHWLRRPRRD